MFKQSKKSHFFVPLLAILTFCLFTADKSASADEWRLHVGLSYVSGFSDVVDAYKDNLEAEGYAITDDVESFPIGIAFNPNYEFDSGFRLGAGLGPLMMILGDREHIEIPLALKAGYSFTPSAGTSPYILAGVSYHYASGDYVDSSSPGAMAAVGIEFFRDKPVGFGVELAYDGAEVDIEIYDSFGNKTIDEIATAKTKLSVFAVF